MHDVLTLEKAENIARLTGHGTITCESLREACPWLNDDILADIVQDDYTGSTLQANRLNARSRPAPILKFVQVPTDYFPHYKFKLEDTLELTVAGQDILYRVEKDDYMRHLAFIAAVSGVISVIATIVSILIAG